MKKTFNQLVFSLVMTFCYELIMIIFKLDGLSNFKVLVTFFIWISCGISFSFFLKNINFIKRNVPSVSFNLLLIYFFWNMINIVRGFLSESGTLTTLLGNVYTTLALLVPIVIGYSIDKINIYRINRYFFILIPIGILFFIYLRLIGLESNDIIILNILSLLFFPVIFLIPQFLLFDTSKKITLFISICILLYVSYLSNNRTMMIREVLLLVGVVVIILYKKFQFKWILIFTYISLLIPFFLFFISLYSNESFFQTILSSFTSSELSNDTRTFLYVDVIEDLAKNGDLLLGKGPNGTYFSNYFYTADGDSSIRLNVEVGILSILLKTGIIGVILYLFILFQAVYFALFKSRNYYVVNIGIMLIIYANLLFVENLVSFSNMNICLWFFIGICFSKEVRGVSNSKIYYLINRYRI